MNKKMMYFLIPIGAAIYALKEVFSTNTILDNILRKYKGIPYVWGGDNITGFDCSGFTQYVYKNYFDKTIPRVSAQQYADSIKVNNPTPGDLVFFSNENSNKIVHVGIYYKDDLFIHSGSSKGVDVGSLNTPYWKQRLVGFGKY